MAEIAPSSQRIDRRAVSGMLMALFDHWKLTTEEQLDALGLARANRGNLTKYRRGQPISASRDTFDRAGHLLGIHKDLLLLFPHNRDLSYAWVKTHNRAFANLRPIDVIREDGFAGLLTVRSYLDRALGR